MRASIASTTVLAALATVMVLPAGAASARPDTRAPKIASVSAPAIVGLTSKGAVFDITVRATDNIDVARVVVGLIDTAGKYEKPVGIVAKRVAGMCQKRSTCSNQTSDTSAACWVFSTSSRRPVS